MATIESMLAGKRILAIDDLVESRSSMKKMLQILGADEVDIAMDGDEATNYILHTDYDLVISDYNLGKGRDGQQILEEARFTHRLKAVSTFVMLTGENAMDMVMGAVEYEPDDYVTKPFTIDVMRKRLTRILSTKEELKPINEAIDAQNYKEVIARCDELLVEKPRLANRILRIKGRTLLRLKQYKKALALYQLILAEREISWALLGKAVSLFYLQELDKSKEVLQYTIKLHPKYVQCFDYLAKIQIQQKDLEAAQMTLRDATKVSPKQVLRQMELGRIAFANKDMAVAESAFRQSVKLARHSCYKSVKTYLMFAKSVQHKISPKNTRDTRTASQEAFRTMDEVKNTYKDNPEYSLEATLIESTTYTNLGKDIDAKLKADEAGEILKKIKQPSPAHQLAMANTYIATKQHAKAQDLLGELTNREDLSNSELRELNKTKEEISETVVREYTTEINDQAIEYFERGQLSQAIELFDKATAYKEAGIAVLLNAIQAKITYMDQRSAEPKMAKEVNELLSRLGNLPESDERHGRWLQLKKSQQRIMRAL